MINRLEVRASLGQFPFHAFVNIVHQRFRKVAASHARLVGDHDDGHSSLVQAANGRGCKRKHTKTVEMIQVADFFGDGAIAIEENGGAAGGGVRQKSPRKGASAARSRPSTE